MVWFNCGYGSVIKDRGDLKARVPELWEIMVVTWGTDNPDSTADAQRCPTTTDNEIKIDCSDFWAGGMPRNLATNPFQVAAPCIQSSETVTPVDTKTIPPSENVLRHFLNCVPTMAVKDLTKTSTLTNQQVTRRRDYRE